MSERPGEAPLIPLLVEGSGRDGTTLMMQLLGTAPEIAFDRVYPFEQRYFSYLLHWARLPTAEYVEGERWNLDHLAHFELLDGHDFTGPIPWPDRTLIGGEEGIWRETFDAAWRCFSQRARAAIRSRLGDEELAVTFYAQKNADSWALDLDRLPQLRLLCLLRDPRDTWLSSVAFHQRRLGEGLTFLPVGPDEPVERALEQFIDDQRARLTWLAGVEAELGAPLVRYEDMVADLPAVAERLGAWLGVRLDAEAVLRRSGEFRAHITSGDVASSVARWRTEMAAPLAAHFAAQMGSELEQLGYEV